MNDEQAGWRADAAAEAAKHGPIHYYNPNDNSKKRNIDDPERSPQPKQRRQHDAAVAWATEERERPKFTANWLDPFLAEHSKQITGRYGKRVVGIEFDQAQKAELAGGDWSLDYGADKDKQLLILEKRHSAAPHTLRIPSRVEWTSLNIAPHNEEGVIIKGWIKEQEQLANAGIDSSSDDLDSDDNPLDAAFLDLCAK